MKYVKLTDEAHHDILNNIVGLQSLMEMPMWNDHKVDILLTLAQLRKQIESAQPIEDSQVSQS